jgi:selenocysteine-specific elongation factor
VILLDCDEVQPGEEVFAQLHLEESAIAAPQDRYVLRSYSPIQTIAGGVILDTLPARHRRRRPAVLEQLTTLRDGTTAEVLAVHLGNAEYAGLPWSDCLLRSPLDEAALRVVLEDLRAQGIGRVIEDSPPWLLHREQYARARTQIVQLLAEFHRANPLKPAMFTEELRSKFPSMPEKVFATLQQDLTASGEIEISRDKVKLTSHTVTLSPARQTAIAALESTFREAAYQPPSADEALEAHKLTQADDRELLQVLVDQQKLVRLKGDLFYHRDVFEAIERQLRTYLEEKGEITAGEFRDLMQISRKYAIPLLEHFDNQRLTMRIGDKRVLRRVG